ncbi:hypothetical protein F4801DRAFT_573823 [Xylaria longipes]|nr:hypothetical protein F4801DRAFT_573823 [Xylaria longipes]
MSYGPLQSNQPLSPWAARHGTVTQSNDAVFKRGPLRHSGLAPERPIFYADKPVTSDAETFLYSDDIDRLFMSVSVQQVLFPGTEPWQFGVLQKTLRLSDQGDIPGGHQEASPSAFKGDPETHPGWKSKLLYDSDMIKPDEESWFSFHHKDRWLDWNHDAPVLGGGPWSIDNPLVWDALTPSLECVNRILRALIRDQHPFLTTLLGGHIGTWEEMTATLSPTLNMPPPFPSATVVLSYDRYSQYKDTCDEGVSAYMEKLPFIHPDDMTQKLEELLATTMWSFHDKPAYGITYPQYNSPISIHVDVLTQLIEGNITLAERCLLQFHLAGIILHEMGHAIMNNRTAEVFDEDTAYWCSHEPASLLPEKSRF